MVSTNENDPSESSANERGINFVCLPCSPPALAENGGMEETSSAVESFQFKSDENCDEQQSIGGGSAEKNNTSAEEEIMVPIICQPVMSAAAGVETEGKMRPITNSNNFMSAGIETSNIKAEEKSVSSNCDDEDDRGQESIEIRIIVEGSEENAKPNDASVETQQVKMEEQHDDTEVPSKNNDHLEESMVQNGGGIDVNPEDCATLSSSGQPMSDVEHENDEALALLDLKQELANPKKDNDETKSVSNAMDDPGTDTGSPAMLPRGDASLSAGAQQEPVINRKAMKSQLTNGASNTDMATTEMPTMEATDEQNINDAPKSQSNESENSGAEWTDDTETDEQAGTKGPTALPPRGNTFSPSAVQSNNDDLDATNATKEEDVREISEGTTPAPGIGEVLPSDNSVQLKNEVSTDVIDETQAKDEPGAKTSPTAPPLRGKVLAAVGKTNELENDVVEAKEKGNIETSTDKCLDSAPSLQIFDASGNPTTQQENDIILSLQIPSYKAVFFEQWQKSGPGNDKNVAKTLFQQFKAGGGRFFKRGHYDKFKYTMVDEDEAIRKISKDMGRRSGRSSPKSLECVIPKKRQSIPKMRVSPYECREISSVKLFDDSGEPTTYQQNDVFLSAKNSSYHDAFHAQFQKMGFSTATKDNLRVSHELFKQFKEGGGRFFKLIPGTGYASVNEEEAFKKIKRHVSRRREYFPQMFDGNIPNKREKNDLACLKIDGDFQGQNPATESSNPVTQRNGRSSRKRSKPQSFIDSQGQELMVQELLREQSAVAKGRKERDKGDGEKPFTLNENRQFEQGCSLHGWGNWDAVHLCVPGRTNIECESYAAMLRKLHPEIKERLMREHKSLWVYPDGSKRPLKEGKPPPMDGEDKKKALNARQSVQEKKEGMPKAEDAASHSSTHTVGKKKKAERKRSKMNKDDTERGLAYKKEPESAVALSRTRAIGNGANKGQDVTKINSAQLVDAVSERRPKRQSALNARKSLKSSLAKEDENDDFLSEEKGLVSSGKVSSSAKSKMQEEKDDLLSQLQNTPSNNGEYYEEESAWRFHNPAFIERSEEQLTTLRSDIIPQMPAPTSLEALKPLPPAPPLPELPSSKYCSWTFDEESRVLLANFRMSGYAKEKNKVKIKSQDEKFLFEMMERDDITVISEGLADALNPNLWTREYIEGCIGSDYHHKFRVFETSLRNNGSAEEPTEQAKENKGWHSMKVSDYFQYLEQRKSVKNEKLDNTNNDRSSTLNESFKFTDSNGEEKSVNVDNEALYMIDVDMVKLLPQASDDFQCNFKLPGILPGGSHCMMNAVNANGRPFMGPNLYITPPSSFTHFHQDGHGTVDSGHLCLSGYNEVVMLRRLTERHKCHAIRLLTGTSDSYSTLYGLPHDDVETQHDWPSGQAIDQCQKMRYYPSVFVLKPGQVVHINKGRLHAFRKLAPSTLRKSDCHFDLRNGILQGKKQPTEDVCFSVAWDWMFKGVTSKGINREISGILECARLNREHNLQSLAIPETSLLFLAKENIAKYGLASKIERTNPLFQTDIPQHQSPIQASEPDAETLLRGILPSLQYVLNRHISASKFSEEWEEKTKHVTKSWRVSIGSKPNAWEDPGAFSLDPYGAGDFFCKFCSEELSNVYMHCDGCEKLLDKDFNICSICHMEGKYKVFHQMHPFNEKKHSILNHTGNKTRLRQARCPCKNGKPCGNCSWCTGCSCRCHQWFTLHYRFMGFNDEREILKQAEDIVACGATLSTAVETKARLFSLISDDLHQPQEEMLTEEVPQFCQVIEAKKQPSRKRRKKEDEPIHSQDASEATVPEQRSKRPKIMSDGQTTDHQAKASNNLPQSQEEILTEEVPQYCQVIEAKKQPSRNRREKEDEPIHCQVASKAAVPEERKKRPRVISDGQTRDQQAKATNRNGLNTEEETSHDHPNTEVPASEKRQKLRRVAKKGHAEYKEKSTTRNEDVEVKAHENATAETLAPKQKMNRPSTMNPSEHKNTAARKIDDKGSAPEQNWNRARNEKTAEHQQSSGNTDEIEPAIGQGGRKEKNDDIDPKTQTESAVAYEPAVTFHCEKCDSTFNFAHASGAAASFGTHVKWCGTKSDRKERRKAAQKSNSADEKDESLDDDSAASVDESISEAIPFDPDEVKAGSRVMVLCKAGKAWQATIKKRWERKNEQGFMIHYDGSKKARREWTPVDGVVGFIQDGIDN